MQLSRAGSTLLVLWLVVAATWLSETGPTHIVHTLALALLTNHTHTHTHVTHTLKFFFFF
jgi:hypothetical protein